MELFVLVHPDLDECDVFLNSMFSYRGQNLLKERNHTNIPFTHKHAMVFRCETTDQAGMSDYC